MCLLIVLNITADESVVLNRVSIHSHTIILIYFHTNTASIWCVCIELCHTHFALYRVFSSSFPLFLWLELKKLKNFKIVQHTLFDGLIGILLESFVKQWTLTTGIFSLSLRVMCTFWQIHPARQKSTTQRMKRFGFK